MMIAQRSAAVLLYCMLLQALACHALYDCHKADDCRGKFQEPSSSKKRGPSRPDPEGWCGPVTLRVANKTVPPAWEPVPAASVYNNGVVKDSQYSHMAMVERLPEKGKAAFLAVWQAAEVVAGGRDMHIRATVSDDLLAWSPTWRIPLPQDGAIWAPVLFLDPAATGAGGPGRESDPLFLFYTESTTCIRDRPKLGDQAYAPGGDIKVVTSQDGKEWSAPRMVLAQVEEGGVPKVIANKPVALDNGDWLLPFWREDPSPISKKCRLAPACRQCKIGKGAPVGLAGTLLSSDRGSTWRVAGNIPRKDPKLLLLEGTAVQLGDGTVLQLFRTSEGHIFKSTSVNRGESWTQARAIDALPNPGSKVSLVLMGEGLLALGYNHHGFEVAGQRGVRSRLRVALSANGGSTWSPLARLEERVLAHTKFHYPTLIPLRGPPTKSRPWRSSGEPDAGGGRGLGGGGHGPDGAGGSGGSPSSRLYAPPEASCVLGVLWSVGDKENAGAGGVRARVLDLDRWLALRLPEAQGAP